MCSTKGFDKVIHWTLILVGIVKLVLDVPCSYMFYTAYYRATHGINNKLNEEVSWKIYLATLLAILKNIFDVFLDIALLYACYKKRKGLLTFHSTYNAVVGALIIVGIWRLWRNLLKKAAISVVNPFSSGFDSNMAAEMYFMFLILAPYTLCYTDALHMDPLVFCLTELVLVHVVLPCLVLWEIKRVKRFHLENLARAILLHLQENPEELVAMTTENSDSSFEI